jgi:hypothetical protein
MQSCFRLVWICLLTQAAISISAAEDETENVGQSSTGRTSWEFRTPPGSFRSEIWLWPADHQEKATRLGGENEAAAFGVQFSQNDDWIVVSRHLSSGNFFSFYHQKPDGAYEEGQGAGANEPVPGFDSVQKMVPKEQIDRWTVNFIRWDPSFGPSAFIFSWDARLDKGLDNFSRHCLGWTGVYDLQKRAIVHTLSTGKVVTETELVEQYLNNNYGELRDLLNSKDKESLQVEENDWLKKREAIKSLQEKVECTVTRVDALKARLSKLDR